VVTRIRTPLVNLNDAWNRIRAAAGLNDLRIHDLRRTVGSWLVRDGASLHLVGSVLNHKDQKTTAGCAYFQTKERRKALDKHGRNVIDFASRVLTASSDPREDAPAAADLNRWQLHTFSREALYKLIWSEPTRTVSKRLGISDVGLAKACRRANIPTPGPGVLGKDQHRPRLSKDAITTDKGRRRCERSNPGTVSCEFKCKAANEFRWPGRIAVDMRSPARLSTSWSVDSPRH
jgi:hypothetical protein